jgi:hypothetical protein
LGESKRRRQHDREYSLHSHDSPAVRDLLEAGQPINVHVFGAQRILYEVRSRNSVEIMAPEMHAFRLAFLMTDRIRTGEIDEWFCSLCAAKHTGLRALSCMSVVERALGDPTPNKPGIVAPVCQACDSVSTDETVRRLQESFGLFAMQEGHA